MVNDPARADNRASFTGDGELLSGFHGDTCDASDRSTAAKRRGSAPLFLALHTNPSGVVGSGQFGEFMWFGDD
jgi:hypothetical protein